MPAAVQRSMGFDDNRPGAERVEEMVAAFRGWVVAMMERDIAASKRALGELNAQGLLVGWRQRTFEAQTKMGPGRG